MPTKAEKTPARTLEDVRQEIDTIDDAIQDLLMKRTELVVEVADAKARSASAAGQGSFIAFRPGREAEVLRRLAGRQRGRMPLKVVFRLFREIIATMTRIQGPFRIEVFGSENKLAYWDLARSYYGSSSEMELHDTARDVLRRLGHDRSAIGILPEPGNYAGGDWWPALAGAGPDGPRIVARIPFLDIEREGDAPRAFVVAQAVFEPTGDDTTLLVISAADRVSDAAMAARVKAVGIEGSRIGVMLTNEGGISRHNLYAIPGYVEADDARIEALTAEGPIEVARIIGGYANPVKRVQDGE